MSLTVCRSIWQKEREIERDVNNVDNSTFHSVNGHVTWSKSNMMISVFLLVSWFLIPPYWV